jgi:hypothetical protein
VVGGGAVGLDDHLLGRPAEIGDRSAEGHIDVGLWQAVL